MVKEPVLLSKQIGFVGVASTVTTEYKVNFSTFLVRGMQNRYQWDSPTILRFQWIHMNCCQLL